MADASEPRTTSSVPTISVVIPAYCEGDRVRLTIRSALEGGADEVLVADASPDGRTAAVAASAGATVVRTRRRGRARQMNAGARKAGGEVLLFLHSDSVLSPGSVEALRRLMAEREEIAGGCLRRTFRTRSPFLRLTCAIGNWRARRLRWFLGDQAIFVRRDLFERIGGFSTEARYEDLDFSRKLRRVARTCLLDVGVTTSARRFRKRRFLRATCDAAIVFAYMLRHSR